MLISTTGFTAILILITMPKQIDAQTLQDEASLKALIQQYNPKLAMMMTSIVGQANVDDVLQEVWLTVIIKIDQFKGKSSFKTWLYRIAYNHAYQWHRQNADHATISIESEDQLDWFKDNNHWQNGQPNNWHIHSPEQLYQLEDFANKLNQFLSELPLQQASFLVRHDAEQIDFSEICNILSVSASNGRVLLHRARQALYKYYNAFMTDKL